jgi:hypothetical protein
MAVWDVPESIVGFLLLFFVPGYAITKALFPEWRVRGALALRRAVEVVTLSFVLSVVLTVLAGYVLLSGAPSGFQAGWSDPVLEAGLAGVTGVAFVAGWLEGAYRRTPPAPSRWALGPSRGEEGAWSLSRELGRLSQEERRLAHALRQASATSQDAHDLSARLARVRAEREALVRQREEEYAE